MNSKDYLQPKTRTELAQELGISRRTLYNWIIKSNLPVKGGILSSKCLKIIYKEFGYPKPRK